MYPLLWESELSGVSVRLTAYRTAFVVACVGAVLVSLLLSRRNGLPGKRCAAVLLIAAASVLIGARLWYGWHHRLDPGFAWTALWHWQLSQFALTGGLVVGAGAFVVAARRLRLPVLPFADCTAPGVLCGLALLRLGCLGKGCCAGHETTLPWGIEFPFGSQTHLHQMTYRADVLLSGPVPVHPTQVYELLVALLCAVIAGCMLHHKARAGWPALTAGILFLVLRQWLWLYRAAT
jgi:phosphatidylglycerol:prolipoprotein diacylglycerol transferase